MLKYVNLNYKPTQNDLICSFYIEPVKGLSVKSASEKIASESSIGTWTKISTMKPSIRKIGAKVFSIKGNWTKIAYPSQLFEQGNMPQILSSIAGNIFGMKAIKNLRLEDIQWPYKIIKSFKGPRYGIPGIRKILKVHERPLIGSIIKPKVGLSSQEQAKNAYILWKNGMDMIKEDENLGNLNFNQFKRRVKLTLKMRKKVEKETGEKKGYVANITAETKEMIKRAKFVEENGGRFCMIDIITSGWSSLQTLRDENLELIIHGHRSGHAAITRNPKHGVSMLVIADVSRLLGIDQLHIGTIIGKMSGSKREVQHIGEEIEKKIIKEDEANHTLAENWHHIKPTFAICSGGLYPTQIPKLMKYLGNDIICQFGGGLFGHPRGPKEGAKAIKQALDASLQNITLKKYAQSHPELKTAIKKWGL